MERIEAALGGGAAANDNVAGLRRRLNVWRVGSRRDDGGRRVPRASPARSAASGAAPARRSQRARSDADGGDAWRQDKAMKVVASWDPPRGSWCSRSPATCPPIPRHAHELWVIPADGKPRSLGTMGAGKQMHMRLADTLADLLQQGATIAISVEPPGGSPTGAPTGPVVASGALTQA